MNFISKYFETTEQYPNNIALDILPYNTWWEYVSTSFLNGFINYVDVKCAFVLARYNSWDEYLKDHCIFIQDPPNSYKWTKFSGTKLEIYEKLIEPGRVIHSKLDSDFKDDVIVLSKLSDKKWMMFWFDRDCSDSSIGRFETNIDDKEVIGDFKIWCSNLKFNYCDIDIGEKSKEIPLHYFQGWISS